MTQIKPNSSSATKFTDESEYHVPKTVDPETCRLAAETGIFKWDGMEHKIAQNRITIVNYFTHGSIQYSTTNIACQGEPMRRKNGQVTDNMLREVHLQILVQKVSVMVIDKEVTAMDGHSLGPLKNGKGQDKTATYIWEHDPEKCELGIVGRITLSTIDGKTFFNHPHLVQLTIGTTKHDPNCQASVLRTDLEGIYLTKAILGLKLNQFNTNSVDINSQYQTQINYLAAEVAKSVSNRYREENGLDCVDILEAELHKTTKLHDNSFIRSLGDISIKFRCTPTVVRAIDNSDECYKHVPVVDGAGKTWFLDPESKILLEKSSQTRCNIATVPVIQSLSGNFYAFDPVPRQVHISHLNSTNPLPDQQTSNRGIYAVDVIHNWLNNAYLQSYQEHLAVIYNVHDSEGQTLDANTQMVRRTYDLVKKVDLESWLMGWSWDRIGGRCSIVVVAILIIYVLICTATWLSKLMIIYGEGLHSFKASAMKALFSQIHLLADAANQRKTINDGHRDTDVETGHT